MHVCARVACGARADCLSRPLARVDRTAKPRPFACVACTGAHARAPPSTCAPSTRAPPRAASLLLATLRPAASDRADPRGSDFVRSLARRRLQPSARAPNARCRSMESVKIGRRSRSLPLAVAAACGLLPQRPLDAATRACAQLTSAAIARHTSAALDSIASDRERSSPANPPLPPPPPFFLLSSAIHSSSASLLLFSGRVL